MNNHPIKQHYVPQLLLRNFKSRTTNTIWCFDKSNNKSFETNINNIACERFFYDLEKGNPEKSIENEMSAIENEASVIIRKIIKQEAFHNITIEEKAVLSLFIALQMYRTKNQLQKNEQFIEIINKFSKEGFNTAFIEDNLLNEEARLSWLSMQKSSRELIPYLLIKKWFLLKSQKEFYISDNPVVLQNNYKHYEHRSNLGLNSEGIEIYLPISDSLAICLICEKLFNKIKRIDPNADFVSAIENGHFCTTEPLNIENINSLQVIFSERFVYSSNYDFNLVKDMINKDPELSKGPRLAIK